MTRAALFLFVVLAACGGKIDPVVEELPFAPQSRSAGYGAIGGMHVTLVDASVPNAKRTLQIQIPELDGTFTIGGGANVALVEADARSTRRLAGLAGTVTIAASNTPSSKPTWGTVRVHVDVRLSDPDDDTRVFHVAGDYDADVTVIG